VGRGVPSPLKKGSGEGAQPPPQNLKKNFWFSVLKKFLCSGQRGGAIAQCPPPKYATAILSILGCNIDLYFKQALQFPKPKTKGRQI